MVVGHLFFCMVVLSSLKMDPKSWLLLQGMEITTCSLQLLEWLMFKDTNNWTWFLEKLEPAIGYGEQHGGQNIMSDMQKALLNAVRDVFPNYEHRFCKRHVFANFSSAGFRGEIYKEYFDVVVYAHTQSEYNIAIENLKAYDVKEWKWVSAMPKEHISRHTFRRNCKTDLVVNSPSDVLKKYILDCRGKPIVTM